LLANFQPGKLNFLGGDPITRHRCQEASVVSGGRLQR